LFFSAIQNALQTGINDPFPVVNNQPADLVLSENLVNNSGLQTLKLQTLGDVRIDKGVTVSPGVSTGLAGSLSIQAKNIDMQGDIHTPGGSVNLSAVALGQNDGNGQITVSETSTIDVSGRWVNDFKDGAFVQATALS